jgi:uncharacterized membrane protein
MTQLSHTAIIALGAGWIVAVIIGVVAAYLFCKNQELINEIDIDSWEHG